MIFFFFLLVSLFRWKMRTFFSSIGGWGGGGACHLKILVPCLQKPEAPPPPPVPPYWKNPSYMYATGRSMHWWLYTGWNGSSHTCTYIYYWQIRKWFRIITFVWIHKRERFRSSKSSFPINTKTFMVVWVMGLSHSKYCIAVYSRKVNTWGRNLWEKMKPCLICDRVEWGQSLMCVLPHSSWMPSYSGSLLWNHTCTYIKHIIFKHTHSSIHWSVSYIF